MPSIIDYAHVLVRLGSDGLESNYPHGGSFSFAPKAKAAIRGWIGAPDTSIHPELASSLCQVLEPYESNMAHLAQEVWEQKLPGEVWVMPASHWAHELQFGNGDWLSPLIIEIGLDPAVLATRTDAAAVQFVPEESAVMCHFVQQLLTNLAGSDFFLAFPHRPAVCTIHHHKQLWWSTIDSNLLRGLDELVPPNKTL